MSWTKIIATYAQPAVYDLSISNPAIDSSGNVYLCIAGLASYPGATEGASLVKVSSSGEMQMARSINNCGRVRVDPAGDVLVAGWGTALPDGFLRKYSPSGMLLATYGFANADYVMKDFAVDSLGNVIAVGKATTPDSSSGFLKRFRY